MLRYDVRGTRCPRPIDVVTWSAPFVFLLVFDIRHSPFAVSQLRPIAREVLGIGYWALGGEDGVEGAEAGMVAIGARCISLHTEFPPPSSSSRWPRSAPPRAVKRRGLAAADEPSMPIHCTLKIRRAEDPPVSHIPYPISHVPCPVSHVMRNSLIFCRRLTDFDVLAVLASRRSKQAPKRLPRGIATAPPEAPESLPKRPQGPRSIHDP